jgi:hypothetical protein
VSSWEWTATACCTAASTSSSSESAAIATVQFITLGVSRQSMYFRAISRSFLLRLSRYSTRKAARSSSRKPNGFERPVPIEIGLEAHQHPVAGGLLR